MHWTYPLPLFLPGVPNLVTVHDLIPLLRPVFLNGFLLVFLASIQNLTLPLMLYSGNNQVLSNLIWDRWNYGDASGTAVLSVVMTAITVVAALFLRGLTGQRAGD